MGPAERQAHRVALGEHRVAAIAIDLQDAGEAGEMGDGPFGLAVGSIDIDDAGRIGAAPGTVIAGIGEELPCLGPAPARIEHRRRRLVGEQPGRALQHRQHPLVHGAQQEGRAPDPVGQRRAIEHDTLAGIDLGLTIQGQMIRFGDQHLGDGRLCRDSALDQPRRCGRLHHDVLAGLAAYFGRRTTRTRNWAGTMSSRSARRWCADR